MFKKIIVTGNDSVLAVLRLVLGVVFFAHGAQKMLGWFGGFGFSGTMGYFTGVVHVPYVLGVLAICAEFFGGISLILGLLSRVGALAVMINMLVAIMLVHAPNGLFMNWNLAVSSPTTAVGEGFEFHVLAIALAFAVLVGGAGAFSIDGVLAPAKATSAARPTA
jgi:putative oxidoreductase